MSLSTATTSATSALLVPYPETSSSATSTTASNNDRQTAVRVRAFSPPSAASSASCLQQRAHSFCINNQRLLQQQRRPGGVPDELQPLNRRSTMATTSAARTSKSLSPSSPSPHHHWWWPVGSALVGGTGGLMTILQRALCNMNHRGEGQYQTVLLTRESADSGLELDRLENGGGLCSAKAEEEEDLNDDEEEEEVEDDDAEEDRRTEEETTATTSRRMMMTETKNRKSPQPPPRLSLGRLLSSFSSFGVSSTQNSANNTNNASNSSSADSHSMFDFPSASPLLMGPLEPSGYAQSPIAQLSRSNAVLMAENQRLANRVQELEHSLRDHVAHLNSVYFTLYQRHGFDALQLPDGEMVQLTQFKGPEVVLLTFVRSPSLPAGVDADGSSPATQQQLAERRHRLQQQIRQQKQAPNSGGQPAQASESSPSSVGSGSASSFQLLGSVSTDSSLDPVEMFHQLCIRPATAGKGGGAEMAEEDRQQIQAYVDWLKCEGATEEANQEAHRLMARLRAQQVQAQVKLANGNGSAAGTPNNKWMAAASSPNSGGRVHFNMEERRKSGSFGGGGSGDSVSSTTRAGQEQQQTRKSQLLLDGWRNEVAGGNGSELLAARGSVDGCLLLMAAESGNGGANASSRTPSPRSAFGGATKGQQRMRSPSAAYLQTRRMSSSATGAIMSGNHIGGNEERSPRRGGGIGLVSACRNTMRVEHRVAKRNLI